MFRRLKELLKRVLFQRKAVNAAGQRELEAQLKVGRALIAKYHGVFRALAK
jgi:hypothetical protein